MAENVLLAALPNYCRWAQNTTSGAVAASTPVSNIFSSEPSQFVLFPEATKSLWNWAEIRFNSDETAANDNRGDDVNVAAIINHNLTPGTGKYCLDIWNGIAVTHLPGTYYETPNGVLSSSNLTGDHTAVDEDPHSPDANWMTVTSVGGDTMAHFSMTSATSSTLIRTGAERQAIVCWVRATGEHAVALAPTLKVDLFDNGVFVRTLRNAVAVTSTAGQLVAGYFNFSEVSSAANLEVKLSATANSGDSVEFGAVRWQIDAAGVGTILYSTGWVAVDAADPGSLVGGASAETVGMDPTRNQLIMVSPSVTGTSKAALIRFRDEDNADGYLKVGLVVISAKFQPEHNVGTVTLGTTDTDTVVKTSGGQSGGANRRRARTFALGWPSLSKAEALTLYDRVAFRKGKLVPFLVSVFPDDAAARNTGTAWVLATRMDGPGSTAGAGIEDGATTTADVRWRVDLQLEEKL